MSEERQKIFLTDSGKKIQMTQEMVDLRDNLSKGLGYALVPCTIGRIHPRADGTPSRPCWERGTHVMDGVEIANEHIVPVMKGERMNMPGADIYHWPDDAIKAAKAIDRNGKPAPKPRFR